MLPMVLKIADKFKIEGESLLKGYEKQIDIEDLEHGVSMPMVSDKSSNSRTSGRCLITEFICTMRLNKAYPKLMEACAKGTNLGKLELVKTKMSEGKICEVVKYVMTDVYVADVMLLPAARGVDGQPLGTSESGETSLPLVRFDLNFQSLAVTYNEYDKTGANKGAVSCDAITGLGA